MHNICTKARKVIGILYRHFYLNADTTSLLQGYLSLVRPILDYACHPHLIKDIQKLNLHYGYAPNNGIWTMICNILTLSARRKFFCLCTMFKIIYKLIYFPHNIFEPRVTTLHPASDLLFSQPFGHTNSFMFSFVPFTCHAWNSLPLSIRSADCISSFKYSLSDESFNNIVYIHVFF